MTGNDLRVVGLDIGGSKTHAVAAGVFDGDVAQQEVLAGSANLSSVGAAEVSRQLTAVFDRLGRAGIIAVCVGAAGVDSADQEQRLRDLVLEQVPGAAIHIVHDSHLILAAAGVEHGIALISGTGSVAWGRTAGGTVARAGGWGYLLGDEGSGYWIGLQAVRHVLNLADREQPPDLLAQRLVADCGLRRPAELLDHFYANPERRYWAERSVAVFDMAAGGDSVGSSIVAAAATSLVDIVTVVGRRLGSAGPVVLGGGLLVHQLLLQSLVRDDLATAGFTDVRVLDADPAQGALQLARRLPLA